MAEYIERDAAILGLLEKGQHSRRYKLGDVWELNFDEIREAIAGISAADVRPVVRGEWGYRWKIHGDGRRPTELFPCSECGYENTSSTHFCPNCGADMREES